jgi:DNA replication licensing factor MCM6
VVGKLLTISGTVTRTSEVRPELLDGNFQCNACGTTIENVPQQFKYTEVRSAPACCCPP